MLLLCCWWDNFPERTCQGINKVLEKKRIVWSSWKSFQLSSRRLHFCRNSEAKSVRWNDTLELHPHGYSWLLGLYACVVHHEHDQRWWPAKSALDLMKRRWRKKKKRSWKNKPLHVPQSEGVTGFEKTHPWLQGWTRAHRQSWLNPNPKNTTQVLTEADPRAEVEPRC